MMSIIRDPSLPSTDKSVIHDSVLFLCLIVTGSLFFLPPSVGSAVNIVYKILMVAFYFLYVPKNVLNKRIRNQYLAIVLLFYWIVNYLRVPSVSLLSIIDFVILVLFCTASTKLQRTTYILLRKLFIVISFFGIIAYIGFALGILSPLSINDFYEEGSGNEYYNYGLSIILVNRLGVAFRLCGLFNEPGMMGTLSALILVAERFNYNRIGNWIIFIAGIFCFSLAFWLILAISLFADAVLNRRRISIIFVVVVVVGYGSLLTLSTGNENVNRLVSRLSLTENNSLSGDQRTSDEFDVFYEQVKKSPEDFLFGTTIREDLIPSSYKRYIVQYGLILSLIIFIPLIILIVKICKGNKWAYMLSICFFASIYQRPLVFDLIYFTILLGGIQNILFMGDGLPQIRQKEHSINNLTNKSIRSL